MQRSASKRAQTSGNGLQSSARPTSGWRGAYRARLGASNQAAIGALKSHRVTVGRQGGHHERAANAAALRAVNGGSVSVMKAPVAGGGDRLAAPAVSTRLTRRIDGLRGSGRPLPAATRAYLEPRFGRSFRDVRIHTGANAAGLADQLNARAFTRGRDIAFRAGAYRPDSVEGLRLLSHELAHVVQQDSTPRTQRANVARQTVPDVQRAPVRVTISHANCNDPRPIAEAINGARLMAATAFNWFLSFGTNDRARVDQLLRLNFFSASESVRDIVRDRILSIRGLLEDAQAGRLTYQCETAADPECQSREGYVRSGEGLLVHICPPFFNLTLEERRWMLIHEAAHLAGAVSQETYFANFGTVDCTSIAGGLNSVNDALGNADSYARFIWCITRRASVMINNPNAPATP